MATKNPVGSGRAEPNHSPFLPPPVGRISFSLNPFTMLVSLIILTSCLGITGWPRSFKKDLWILLFNSMCRFMYCNVTNDQFKSRFSNDHEHFLSNIILSFIYLLLYDCVLSKR